MSASVDSADDLCHLHPHPGPHILTRLPHQHESRVLHRLLYRSKYFFKRRKYFFLEIFYLQDGYQNTIANMTTFNRRMTDQLKKSLQKVSLYELEGAERK